MDSGAGVTHYLRTRCRAARLTFERDWDLGVVEISMMGFQGQTVVGSMVGLIQSVIFASLTVVFLSVAVRHEEH